MSTTQSSDLVNVESHILDRGQLFAEAEALLAQACPQERVHLASNTCWFFATTIGIPGWTDSDVLATFDAELLPGFVSDRVWQDAALQAVEDIYAVALVLADRDQAHDAVRLLAGLAELQRVCRLSEMRDRLPNARSGTPV